MKAECRMSNNGLKYPLTELKKVVSKWLYPENDTIVDIVTAVYVANRLESDPLWLMIIGSPSNTKTELLRAYENHKNAYFISNLTPSTLVSGIKPKNGQDPSLLPRLNDKLVVLKDFTTILSMRSEQQAEVIAQLRETYDGQYSKIFGNGKELNWSGRFGLLAACTPSYDSHHAVIGPMGERFILYRTENSNGIQMGLQAQKIVGQESTMRKEIRNAVHKFIDQFDNLELANFEPDEEINNMIVALSCFVAYGRCPVERDYRNQTIRYQPLPEGTPRLVKQFMQMGIGLALIYCKKQIDEDVYTIIKKIGRDLITTQRLLILKHLWEMRAAEFIGHWLKTKEIADAVNIPTTTVRLILEDFMVIGALNRDLIDDGDKAPYVWQINQQMCKWISQSEVFDNV